MPRGLIDLKGQTFGRLTVTRFHKSIRSGRRKRVFWFCACECGAKDISVRGDGLRYGHTKSCGCILRDARTRQSALLTVNGVTKHASEWARAYGIRVGNIYDRLRYGMDVEQAITTPVGKRGQKIRQNSFCTSDRR